MLHKNLSMVVQSWIKANPNYVNIIAESSPSNKNSLFYFYKKLIHLRKTLDVITNGKFELIEENNSQIFSYKRYNDQDYLTIICNSYNQTTIFYLA